MSGLAPVSIIVPHYNDLARLDICLGALRAQDYPPDLVEIVVADNNSPCDRAQLLAVIADRATLIICDIKGAGPARNAGLAAASHSLLAFTDSDCVVDKGWLKAGIAALKHADLVGGRMMVSVREHGPISGAEAFERVFGFDNRAYVLHERFSVTANLFTRAEVFASVGGFRPDVAEDKDWCHRAIAAGFRIGYASEALVVHPARADWTELVRKWERLQYESFALASERHWGRLRWLARSWLLPLSIAAHVPRVLGSSQLRGVSERLRALATLARIRLWRFGHAQRIGLKGR